MDKITWGNDGWPQIRNRIPSVISDVPLFGEAADVKKVSGVNPSAEVKAVYNLMGITTSEQKGQSLSIVQFMDGTARKIAQK